MRHHCRENQFGSENQIIDIHDHFTSCSRACSRTVHGKFMRVKRHVYVGVHGPRSWPVPGPFQAVSGAVHGHERPHARVVSGFRSPETCHWISTAALKIGHQAGCRRCAHAYTLAVARWSLKIQIPLRFQRFQSNAKLHVHWQAVLDNHEFVRDMAS